MKSFIRVLSNMAHVLIQRKNVCAKMTESGSSIHMFTDTERHMNMEAVLLGTSRSQRTPKLSASH